MPGIPLIVLAYVKDPSLVRYVGGGNIRQEAHRC
jgi:hypothetical protein